MRAAMMLAALVALAACGADGPPVRPTAELNLQFGTNGADLSGSVGAQAGPVSLGVAL